MLLFSLLIGPPGAGKSTTLRCLQAIGSDQTSFSIVSPSDPARATRGVDIQSLSPPIDEEDCSQVDFSHPKEPALEICIMDFGGHIEYRCLQESMLDLHTYFSVLVLSAYGSHISLCLRISVSSL